MDHGVNAEDGSRADDAFLTEFALRPRTRARAGSATATRSEGIPLVARGTPYPRDRHGHNGRIVLAGGYGGMAGFRHVMDDLGIEVVEEELTFKVVQLRNAATGGPLTDDELRFIAGYPGQLAHL